MRPTQTDVIEIALCSIMIIMRQLETRFKGESERERIKIIRDNWKEKKERRVFYWRLYKTHQVQPLTTWGRNSRSNKWLKGPWPTSCRRPSIWMNNMNMVTKIETTLFPFWLKCRRQNLLPASFIVWISKWSIPSSKPCKICTLIRTGQLKLILTTMTQSRMNLILFQLLNSFPSKPIHPKRMFKPGMLSPRTNQVRHA